MISNIERITLADGASKVVLELPDPTSAASKTAVLDIFNDPLQCPRGCSLVYNIHHPPFGEGLFTVLYKEWRDNAQKTIHQDHNEDEVVKTSDDVGTRPFTSSYMDKFLDGTAKVYPANRKIANPPVTPGGVDLPYFEWTDLTNCIAVNNGVEKNAGGNLWNASCRSVEEWTGDGTVKYTVPVNPGFSVRKMLQIMDSTGTTGSGPDVADADNFGAWFNSNWVGAYYNTTFIGIQYSGIIADDVVAIRSNSGAIEILVNDSVVYTFAAVPPASMAARLSMHWENSVLHEVEKI